MTRDELIRNMREGKVECPKCKSKNLFLADKCEKDIHFWICEDCGNVFQDPEEVEDGFAISLCAACIFGVGLLSGITLHLILPIIAAILILAPLFSFALSHGDRVRKLYAELTGTAEADEPNPQKAPASTDAPVLATIKAKYKTTDGIHFLVWLPNIGKNIELRFADPRFEQLKEGDKGLIQYTSDPEHNARTLISFERV